MKRSLALLLALVMSLGLLAGCGSKDTTADEPQQDGESGGSLQEALDNLERELIIESLKSSRGNCSRFGRGACWQVSQ